MSEELDALNDELASVAMRIAALLSKERYDEAELAELDARAKDLRARIAALKEPARQARADRSYYSRELSGG
jgi:chromosome segregation ATPase